MSMRRCASVVVVLLMSLTGCTGTGGTDAPPRVQEPPVRPGLALAPSTFDQVWVCGPDVTYVQGSNGNSPCASGGTPQRIQQLEDELLDARPVAADADCVRHSRRLTLTLSKRGAMGLHLPSVEVLVRCGLAHRIGSEDYYRLADSGRQLLSDMATGKLA